MSRFMLTSHVFHRYNWCHVIDTTPQLYVIMRLGIKLKSMSVRFWRWTLDIPSFASESLYCSPYACHNRGIWLLAFFSYLFCQSFLDYGAFWFHPSTCCKHKECVYFNDFQL